VKYKSLHPMVEVRKEMRETEEKKMQEARNKALEKFMPKQPAAPSPVTKESAKADTGLVPKLEAKPEPKPERKKSKVERDTEEKSMERPKDATNPLEDVKGIE
jgi:hypothetical protein